MGDWDGGERERGMCKILLSRERSREISWHFALNLRLFLDWAIVGPLEARIFEIYEIYALRLNSWCVEAKRTKIKPLRPQCSSTYPSPPLFLFLSLFLSLSFSFPSFFPSPLFHTISGSFHPPGAAYWAERSFWWIRVTILRNVSWMSIVVRQLFPNSGAHRAGKFTPLFLAQYLPRREEEEEKGSTIRT